MDAWVRDRDQACIRVQGMQGMHEPNQLCCMLLAGGGTLLRLRCEVLLNEWQLLRLVA